MSQIEKMIHVAKAVDALSALSRQPDASDDKANEILRDSGMVSKFFDGIDSPSHMLISVVGDSAYVTINDGSGGQPITIQMSMEKAAQMAAWILGAE